jgi:two-component system heavy metal sensor histidine kinase CusS
MKTHSGSIQRKLQGGFCLAAMLLAGLMALFMDRALHHSLELEDAQVMEGQARALVQGLARGDMPLDPEGAPRPEKAAWRVLDATGSVLSQSRDLPDLTGVPFPEAGGALLEVKTPGGRTLSLLGRPWSHAQGKGTLQLVLDRSHEEALIHGFRRTLLLGVVLAMGGAALVARTIARWGLAPLHALIREADSISDRNLDRRLASEHFPLELQELVGTLNAALARLQGAFERVGNLGAELAHELRTPLQNLRSTLENRILQAGGAPVPPADLGILVEDCDRMAALIEQILFLARAEHAPAGLSRERVPARELLEEVQGFFEAAAEEAGVALRVDAEPELEVPGDRQLLTRALHNLCANALRHTPRGGRVGLGAKVQGECICLFVEDTGPGIPAQWIPRLGTPFLRPPESRSAEGYGLGLAIVKRIATLLGGEMVLESPVGQGTQAQIRFPRS